MIARIGVDAWVGENQVQLVHRVHVPSEELRLALARVSQVRANGASGAPDIELHEVVVDVVLAQDDELALRPLIIMLLPAI